MSATSGKFSFFKFILLLLFLPLLLVVAVPLLLFGAYAYADLFYRVISVKIQMARNRRTISANTLKYRLTSGSDPGTFIIESYTIGWPVGRVWWTPDALPIEAQLFGPGFSNDRIDDEPNPRHESLHDTYTNLKTGQALLLMSRVRKSTPQKLQATFPTIPQFSLWTGMIEAQRHYRSEQTKT